MKSLRFDRLSKGAIAVAFSLLSIAFVPTGMAQAAQKVHVDIPAQDLSAALTQFGRETGTEIVFAPDAVREKKAVAVKGEFERNQALKLILEGSGLTYRVTTQGAIVVESLKNSSADENHMTGLRLSQSETESMKKVENTENQNSTASNSQESSSEDSSKGKIQEIVVTGTRFGGRNVLESPVPVDVVSAESLRAGGRTELAEALSVQVPALSFDPVAVASSASAVRPFSYRGLPPEELLILVNGKRWHLSAVNSAKTYFDFNSIPSTAIDHVEVLRDGASAQYGSDAIAGVVNLFLRKDAGTEVVATTGQYYEGDGNTTEFGLDHGWQFADSGFLHVSAYYRSADPTNRQGTDISQQYFDGDPREATGVDRNNNFQIGNAQRREAGMSFNFETPFSETFTAYAFGGYTDRTSETKLIWRNPNRDTNVRAIYPDGYAPIMDVHISDLNAAAGIRGEAGGWNWDLSESYGFSRVKNFMDHSVNVSLGADSPTSFYRGLDKVSQATTNLDFRRSLEVGLNAPLRIALGTEFRNESYKSGAGDSASYIYGGVPILDGPNAGGIAAIGSQGSSGYRPDEVGSESRHSIGAYIDVENQVTEPLLLTGAARYERYSGFGSTVNGKVSFLMQLAPAFALRGSASSGFRAPSLTESNFSTTDSAFFNGEFFVTRNFRVSSPVAVLLGAQPLKPEKSTSFSLGSTFALGSGLGFTLDVYRTYVDNAIVTSNTFFGLTDFLAAQGYPNIAGATYSINAVDKRVDGVDFTANYLVGLGNASRLNLSAAANYSRQRVLRVADAPPELAALTSASWSLVIGGATRDTPSSRINLSANYRIANWELLLRGTRYGAMRWLSYAPPDTTENFSNEWVADLEGSYHLTEAVMLTLGAQNFLDNYPKRIKALNDLPGGVLRYPYVLGAPFGMSGGFYYARASFKF